jgi:hypothetical protein
MLLAAQLAGLRRDVAEALFAQMTTAYREGGEAMRRAVLADLRTRIERDEHAVETARFAEDRAFSRFVLDQHQTLAEVVSALPPVGDAP